MKLIKSIPFVLFVLVPILYSCETRKQEQDVIVLKDWHILGPFETVSNTDNLVFDNLGKWGFNEKDIDYSTFVSIAPDSGITNSIDTIDSHIIDFNKHFSTGDFLGNAYAACSFDANDTSGYYINFSCDDGGKVYLNNEEFIVLPRVGAMIDYEIYKPVKLKKGRNFLLLKVNNSLMDWQAHIKIKKYSAEEMDKHKNVLMWLNNNTFFESSIYDTTTLMILSKNLSGTEAKFEIYTADNIRVFEGVANNKEQYPDISILPDGLYYSILHLNDIDLTQDIYKGDLEKVLIRLTNHLKKLETDDPEIRGTIEANTTRFLHLMKPENRGSSFSDKQNRQRKLIYLYKTLATIENNILTGNKNLDIPGIVLHSFVSDIDDQNQFYVSHAPRNYDSKTKYPVAIYVPGRVENHRPYLESMRVADVAFQENLQYWSEKYQMIVLEPFGREVGWFNFNSIGETDLFELLSSAERAYNMDTTRIFLIGSCASADKALRLAVRHPHLFTGMGFVSPAFAQNFSEHEWDQCNLPFDFIENIKKMPVLIIHSKNDKHTDISNSLFFEKLAIENNLERFTFIQTENDIEEFLWYKYSKNIFEFISKLGPDSLKVLNSLKMNDFKYNTNNTITILERNNPKEISRVAFSVDKNNIYVETSNVSNYEIDLSNIHLNKNEPVSILEHDTGIYSGVFPQNGIFVKNPRGNWKDKPLEGPFTKIFADRFIIVVGSSGSSQENNRNEKTAQFFNNAWKEKYFNDCLVKYDYRITDSDIKNSNLFLIGDFKSNRILKKLEGKIPLNITDSGITIGGHSGNTKDLNVYFIYPDPLNKSRYIGVFNGNTDQNLFSLMDIKVDEYLQLLNLYKEENAIFDISCFGWYDYKIWDDYGNTLYSGYFEDNQLN